MATGLPANPNVSLPGNNIRDILNQAFSSETLLGTAPSAEFRTGAAFTEDTQAARDQAILQLLGGQGFFTQNPQMQAAFQAAQGGGQGDAALQQALTQQFRTGDVGSFVPGQEKEFQSMQGVEDLVAAQQAQGLRQFQDVKGQLKAGFGGSAFSSQTRGTQERAGESAFRDISEQAAKTRFQATEAANQRNLQAIMQQRALGAAGEQGLFQRQLTADQLAAQTALGVGQTQQQFGIDQASLLAQLAGITGEQNIGQLSALMGLLGGQEQETIGIGLGGTSGILPGILQGAAQGAAASDKKLKKDIVHFDKGTLSKLRNLKGAKWNWKEKERNHTGKKTGGVVAQELQKALPELVSESEQFDFNSNKTKKILQVDYHGLTGALITALGELADKVETLEKA